MLMDPPTNSMQMSNIAVLQPQQVVARPKVKFKLSLP